MKEKITILIQNLITYDYILFGSSFVLFILFIILAIVARKKVWLSLLITLLSFAILLLAPTLGYVKMHEYLFKNSTQLLSQKKLEFTQAVVVKGSLTNESKVNFTTCKITANAFKVSGNKLKDTIYALVPFKKMSIIESDISKGQTRDFKIIIEPFTYSKEYNISIGADCR